MIEKLGNYYWKDDVKCDVNDSYRFTSAPVYEVLRVMDGVPLFYDAHIKRLRHSLIIKDLEFNIDDETLLKPIMQWIHDHEIMNFNIRIEIGLNGQHRETCVIMAVKPSYPEETVYREGVKVTLETITRKNPHAKVLYTEYQERVAQIRKDRNAFEVLLQGEDGKLTEGSRSNLFWIKGDTVYSAKGEDVLLGISRKKLLEAMGVLKLNLVERDIYLEEIDQFEAAFLSGTSIHLLPIAQIDDKLYASANHPLLISLMKAFEVKVSASIQSMKERTTKWFQ